VRSLRGKRAQGVIFLCLGVGTRRASCDASSDRAHPTCVLVVESPDDAAHSRDGVTDDPSQQSPTSINSVCPAGKDLVGNVAAMWSRSMSTKQDGDKAMNRRALRFICHLLSLVCCAPEERSAVHDGEIPDIRKGKSAGPPVPAQTQLEDATAATLLCLHPLFRPSSP
jgi:hypothetical protein